VDYEAPAVVRLGTIAATVQGGQVMSLDVDNATPLD